MGQIRVETTITVTNDDGTETVIQKDKTFSSLTDIDVRQYTLAKDATQILWDPVNESTENMASFGLLIAIADGVLDLEFTANEGDGNEELATVRLTDALPLMLGADDAYSNHSASDAFAGTLDVVDKIRVDEPESAARVLTFIMAN